MKLNGTLILILVVALAAFSMVAWTDGEDKPVCPRTGQTTDCTVDGPHGPHGPRGPHGMTGPHHDPDRMAEALDLTDEQRQAMHEIMSAAREATRLQMETALSGILTPEQLDQLEELKTRRGTRGDRERSDRKGRKDKKAAKGGNREDKADHRLERMTESLDLTPEQQDQIRQILEEAAPPPRSEVQDSIREVLTPEQQEKMDRRQQHPGTGRVEGKDRMHGRQGRSAGQSPHGPGRDDLRQLAEQLQLTDEQRTAVRELMTEIRAEQQIETRSRIEELLTPEQREKLEQLHQ